MEREDVSAPPRWRRPLVAGAALLVAAGLFYAAAGFWLVPHLIETRLPQWFDQKYGLKLTVGHVRLNPFLFAGQVDDVALRAANGTELMRADAISVDAAPSALWHRTWRIQRLTLTGLALNLVLSRDGELNLLALRDRFMPAPSGSQSEPLRLVVDDLAVVHASVLFTDLRGATPAKVSITPIGFEMTGLSTATAGKAIHTLTAGLPGGGRLDARGELVLQPALAAYGQVKLAGLQAATGLPFLRQTLHIKDLKGGADLSGAYAYTAPEGLRMDQVGLHLTDLSLEAPDLSAPLIVMKKVDVAGGRIDLKAHEASLATLVMSGGTVSTDIAADGRIGWSRLAPVAPAGASAPAGADWHLGIDSLRLDKVALALDDRQFAPPLVATVASLGAALKLALVTGAHTEIRASGIAIEAHAVELPAASEGGPGLAIGSVAVKSGSFDLAKRQVAAADVSISRGEVSIARLADGSIDWVQRFAPPRLDAADPGGRVAPPWQYALGQLALQGVAVKVRDQTLSPPLALGAQLDATMEHLGSQGPVSFDATLALDANEGTVKATGTATPATGAAQARVVAKAVALKPLQPLLSSYTTLALQSGQADGDLAVTYAPGAAGVVQVSGQFGLEKLALNDNASGAKVVSFERLAAAQLTFDSAARRLSIGDINLLRPDLKIAIAKDRSVNLGELINGSKTPTRAPTASAASSAPAFDVAVRQVRVREGSVDFSDQSLVLPFATRVHAIDATIAGISNDAAHRAEVRAGGSIQPYGSASVDGSFAPADPRRYTDLRVKFNNVLVQPFSPYTATFAGRKLQSGKLWLDLDYKIDHGDLLGENDIRLAEFTLGERVESATAIDVPLNLAVSLLTDSDGQIRLSVPVRGDLDNPRFSVGDAVVQALGNVLGRIVSAPFRLIGRLFGGNGDALSSVEFEPGSAVLAPQEREKLDTLTQALRQRPLLRLVVGAPYDASADTLALQQAETRRQLAAALNRDAGTDGTDASVVAFDDPATRKILQALAQQRGVASTATAQAASPGDERARYEAMFDRVARQQPIGAAAAPLLATQRAAAIAQYLTGDGIERSRVQTGQVQSVSAKRGGVDAALTVSSANDAP